MACGVIAPDAGIQALPIFVFCSRLADLGMSEDAMTAIEPPVRPPDEGVQRFVRILPAEAIQQHRCARRDIQGKLDVLASGGCQPPDFFPVGGDGRRIRGLTPPARQGVRHVIPVLIRDEHQVGSRPHPHATEAQFQAADKVQTLDEHLAILERAVAVGVFQDDDLVLALPVLGAVGIGVGFGHP